MGSSHFNAWVESIIDNLNLKTNSLNFSIHKLKPQHYKKLSSIYNESDDDGYADEIAESIIAEAHGFDDSEIMQLELMDHYINSGNYDLEFD